MEGDHRQAKRQLGKGKGRNRGRPLKEVGTSWNERKNEKANFGTQEHNRSQLPPYRNHKQRKRYATCHPNACSSRDRPTGPSSALTTKPCKGEIKSDC